MTQPITRRFRALLAGAAAAALALGACSNDTTATQTEAEAPQTTVASDATFPVDVSTGGPDSTTTITIEALPEAIISLSPTATETLFAIGAGDQVIAVDDNSNYPEEAPTTDLSGFEPNVEAILGYGPDLVVSATDNPDMIGALEQAGVPTLVLPSAVDLDDAYDQMARLGLATGHITESTDLVETMQAEIGSIVAEAPELTGTTYFHELDPTLYTVTGSTFIGQVYSLFGLESIAEDGTDAYPQLSEEYVVDADPNLIFLADTQCCQVTSAVIAERAGWENLTAVTGGNVVELDADISSRWGPRVVDFVETIGEQVTELDSGDE
ncbi:MAG: ABC transporter substrate-binding protein [Arachnia sp.]